jgi:phosphate transport system permease protein
MHGAAGVLGAIYLVEYGRGRFATDVRFFVDVMTGIPSIVAGLFMLAFWVLIVRPWFNNGTPRFSGFAAALALTVLMLPTIVRSTEEMLRLVPDPLREARTRSASPQWKTILEDRPADRAARHRHRRHARRRPARPARRRRCCWSPAAPRRSTSTRSRATSPRWLCTCTSRPGRLAVRAPRAWTAALTLVAIVLILTIAAKLLARRNRLTAKRCPPWPSASKRATSRRTTARSRRSTASR